MKWYIPSWNGDLRLTPSEKNDHHTTLTIEKPTAGERKILISMGKVFLEKEWVKEWKPPAVHKLFDRAKKIDLAAPLEEVGPVVAKLMKPQEAVLSAITFKDGRVETCSGTLAELEEMAAEAAKAEPKKGASAAATVKRPTPSCPQCVPGSVEPAREVLLAFLDEEEHRSWAKDRTIVVTGGLSGCRYVLAHRHSPLAARIGRICFDLDTNCVVHFHDMTVPPEEEVLAAKLILEHREPWLRNEATMLGVPSDTAAMVFKNPFGDYFDGVADANLTRRIGDSVSRLFGIDPARVTT